jgi:type I restriction enzyme, S subunit
MATSQDFVNWVCGPEIDPAFLAYLLRAARGYVRSLSSGAIHQTVYVPTVKAFRSVFHQYRSSDGLQRP